MSHIASIFAKLADKCNESLHFFTLNLLRFVLNKRHCHANIPAVVSVLAIK